MGAKASSAVHQPTNGRTASAQLRHAPNGQQTRLRLRTRSLGFASQTSSPESSPDRAHSSRIVSMHGASAAALLHGDLKCPICHKTLRCLDDLECHIVMCITRPRLTYNEQVLEEELNEECAICLEELVQGQTIARLPCFCVYHKHCIDGWFKVNRVCPQHPDD